VTPPGPDGLIQRALLGAAVAGGVALAARRTRALAIDGALAATAVGIACAAAGWDWAAALIVFFLLASMWSRIGREGKEVRTAGVLSKGGERDAVQVVANGGLFAACAIGCVVTQQCSGVSSPTTNGGWLKVWQFLAAGALAAASGDTWATELGTLWGGIPRSIVTGRRVEPGTSGGVTVIGTIGGALGAAAIAATVWILGWGPRVASAAVAGGVGGMGVDSLLGATLQGRRWCGACNVSTERTVHTCGVPSHAAGGLEWLDNDGVNALSTLGGACIASVVFWSMR